MFAGHGSPQIGKLLSQKMMEKFILNYAKMWQIDVSEIKYHPLMSSEKSSKLFSPKDLLTFNSPSISDAHSYECKSDDIWLQNYPLYFRKKSCSLTETDCQKLVQDSLDILKEISLPHAQEAFHIMKIVRFIDEDVACVSQFVELEKFNNTASMLPESVSNASKKKPNQTHFAVTYSELFGLFFFGKSYFNDPVMLSSRIAHECGHHLTYSLICSDPLFLCSPNEMFFSAPRAAERPIRNVLDGLIAAEREFTIVTKQLSLIDSTSSLLSAETMRIIEMLRKSDPYLRQKHANLFREMLKSIESLKTAPLTTVGNKIVMSVMESLEFSKVQ